MNKFKARNLFLAFILMVTIICLAVTFTVFFKGLYYFDIHYLHIDEMTNLTTEQIRHNYDVLIQYQSIFYQGDLVLPDFVMSASGAHHFAEVKTIFEIVQVLTVIGLIISIPVTIYKFKTKDFIYFKYVSIVTVVVPVVIGLLASIDFSKAFVIFHQIMFNNNDWIFDPRYDPVIMILPQAYFMHCFLLIILIVILLSGLYYASYRYLLKKELSD